MGAAGGTRSRAGSARAGRVAALGLLATLNYSICTQISAPL